MLRRKVAYLRNNLNENTWGPFSQPEARIENSKCLLVGSCILRDINNSQLVYIIITSIHDGVITHVKRVVSNIKDQQFRVTILPGEMIVTLTIAMRKKS